MTYIELYRIQIYRKRKLPDCVIRIYFLRETGTGCKTKWFLIKYIVHFTTLSYLFGKSDLSQFQSSTSKKESLTL